MGGLMSSVSGFSQSQPADPVDAAKLLREIEDIQEKTKSALKMTAWPDLSQAGKASALAKVSAIMLGGKFFQLSQFYSKDQRAIAEDYWNRGLKCLRDYCHYPIANPDANFDNWFEISTFCLQYIKSNWNPEEKVRLLKEALEAINQALAIDPNSSKAKFRKFLFLKTLEESGEVPPEEPMLWFREFLDSHPDPHSKEYLDYAQLYGGELARRGNLSVATSWFESLLERKPHPITYLYLGKVQNQMKRTALALASIQAALRLDPENVEIKLWFISVKVEDRINTFNQMNRHPTQEEIGDWVATCNEFCTLFAQQGDHFTGTASTFISMKNLGRHIYLTQLPKLANILTHLQQYPFALSLYEHILEISQFYLELNLFDPSEIVKLHSTVGGLCLKMESYEKAEIHLLKALELDKNYLVAYENLVAVYSSQNNENKLNELRAQVEPLITTTDQTELASGILFNFGTAYALLAKESSSPLLETSKEHYSRAIECDPDNIGAKIMLARVLVIAGERQNLEQARELLTQKRRTSHPFEEAPFKLFQLHYCLAGIHALLGNIPEAKKAAIEAGKTHVDPEQVRLLQSYLDNSNKVEPAIFVDQIIKSIRKVEIGFRIGKFINPQAMTIEPDNFIGYHGTIDSSAAEIQKKIVPCGAVKRQFDGKGFYIAENRDIACYFAIRKAQEEQTGRPVVLKVYSTAALVGQAVQSCFKVKRDVLRQYDFIKAPIDGYEAFTQHYVFENSLDKLSASAEQEPVTWSDEEFDHFLKNWTRSGC